LQAEAQNDPDHQPPRSRRAQRRPILHRKESFLTTDHPLHAKFARLSEQEEKRGLLDDAATIGTRDGWQARLSATGFMLRGHRLVRRKSIVETPVASVENREPRVHRSL
jgi:hypothetical protein